MPYQAVFKRYELKYILTPAQKALILEAMEPYMALDQYGRTTIRNIYFDTLNYRLIRHSIEKPAYKEKLRIRCYGKAAHYSMVFVELKKKYDSVVYKRRVSLPVDEALQWITERVSNGPPTQIGREIDYFLSYYDTLRPVVFLSYEREAYYALDGCGLRVTFDENILSRQTDLSLCAPVGGTPLLPDGRTLMEIKCSGSIPIWMVHALSRGHIYKSSFSKYGTAYQTMIYPQHKGERYHA